MKNNSLKIAGLILLFLVSIAFATPFIFKAKIINRVKNRLNANLRAHVDFTDADLSWFRHFPNMGMGLDNFQVIGNGEFSNDTLIAANQLDLSFSIFSLLSGDSIRIYSITAKQARIHALVHKNGHRNWNIGLTRFTKNGRTEVRSKSFKLELQRYDIQNSFISYTDESTHRSVTMINVNHEAVGDFSSELFTLKTNTVADAVSFDNATGVSCHINAKVNMNIAFQVDRKLHIYSFTSNQVSFNDLNLHTKGFFQWPNDSTCNMDIQFNTPSKDFKNILSIVPSIYKNDYSNVKASGDAIMEGCIKGKYDNDHLPAYHLNFDIKNGFFQYADLPEPVQHINVTAHLDNPDGIADHTIINVMQGHAELGNDTLDFHLLLKNPVTELSIDAAIKGKLDFAKISQWTKLEPGTRLKGLLTADVYAKGNEPGTEKRTIKAFNAVGGFDLSNFEYISNYYPGGVTLNDLLVSFHSNNITINELKGEYLNTHFTADGAVNNLFGYLAKNKPLEGFLHLKADELSLNDWLGINKDAAAKSISSNTHIPFAVPSNINFLISVDAGKVHCDNLDLQNLSGGFQISEETIKFGHIKADALEGTLMINGSYSTKESRRNPDIALDYDVMGLDIQKAFFASNTLQKIMPIGKFISGKICAQMNLKGKLDENLIPDLRTLTGKGNLLLVEGVVKDFGPLDNLAESLDVVGLKNIAVKDVKTYFSFKNERVSVTSFHVNVNDLDMEIGGSHGFDQSLDYAINLKVPKKQLGIKGKTWVKNVITQAADKGVPIQLSDDVNMNVMMGGTINSPIVKTDMNEVFDNAANTLTQEVNDFVKAKLDSAKQQLQDPTPAPKRKILAHLYDHNKRQYNAKKGPQLAHHKVNPAKSKRKLKNSRKYSATVTRK
jgi:AsmA-like C-terminal region